MRSFRSTLATGVAIAAAGGLCLLGAGAAHAATTGNGNGDCSYAGQTYPDGTIAKDISKDTKIVCAEGEWYAIIEPQDQGGPAQPTEP